MYGSGVNSYGPTQQVQTGYVQQARQQQQVPVNYGQVNQAKMGPNTVPVPPAKTSSSQNVQKNELPMTPSIDTEIKEGIGKLKQLSEKLEGKVKKLELSLGDPPVPYTLTKSDGGISLQTTAQARNNKGSHGVFLPKDGSVPKYLNNPSLAHLRGSLAELGKREDASLQKLEQEIEKKVGEKNKPFMNKFITFGNAAKNAAIGVFGSIIGHAIHSASSKAEIAAKPVEQGNLAKAAAKVEINEVEANATEVNTKAEAREYCQGRTDFQLSENLMQLTDAKMKIRKEETNGKGIIFNSENNKFELVDNPDAAQVKKAEIFAQTVMDDIQMKRKWGGR